MQLRVMTNVEGLKLHQRFEVQIRETEAKVQVCRTTKRRLEFPALLIVKYMASDIKLPGFEPWLGYFLSVGGTLSSSVSSSI